MASRTRGWIHRRIFLFPSLTPPAKRTWKSERKGARKFTCRINSRNGCATSARESLFVTHENHWATSSNVFHKYVWIIGKRIFPNRQRFFVTARALCFERSFCPFCHDIHFSYFAADERVDNGSSDPERETDENRSPGGDAEVRIALRSEWRARVSASEKKVGPNCTAALRHVHNALPERFLYISKSLQALPREEEPAN